jgi:small basic protein (TIGR04137 family)
LEIEYSSKKIAVFERWVGFIHRAGRSSRNLKIGKKMTIDRSLKIKVGGNKSRNVLRRDERIAKLMAGERWQDGDAIFGMPKVRVEKISLKKKKKVKTEEETKGKKK